MITVTELAQKEAAYKTAQQYYLTLCNMHEQGLCKHNAVKAALDRAKSLEAAFSKAWLDYQSQAIERK